MSIPEVTPAIVIKPEVIEALQKHGLFEDGWSVQVGKLDGDDFVVVSSSDVVEQIESVINGSGITFDGHEGETVDIDTILSDSWGYDDEYCSCHECGGFIKTSPDYYGSPVKYMDIGTKYDDITRLCLQCGESQKAEYVEDRINQPSNAVHGTIVSDDELIEIGLRKYNTRSYQSGWYEGQTDHPETIYDQLKHQYDVVFVIDYTGQFDVHFSAWVRDKEE